MENKIPSGSDTQPSQLFSTSLSTRYAAKTNCC
jgi:hypothetical protein